MYVLFGGELTARKGNTAETARTTIYTVAKHYVDETPLSSPKETKKEKKKDQLMKKLTELKDCFTGVC